MYSGHLFWKPSYLKMLDDDKNKVVCLGCLTIQNILCLFYYECSFYLWCLTKRNELWPLCKQMRLFLERNAVNILLCIIDFTFLRAFEFRANH